MNASSRPAMALARTGSAPCGTPQTVRARTVPGPCHSSPAAMDSQRCTAAAGAAASGSQGPPAS